MSNPLLDNIRKMRNDELVGLAKNRFLPEDLQLALIDIPYRTGHMWLMENGGLTTKARDMLWSDRINSGYTYKATLINFGHYRDDTDKYWELFDKYPSAWTRSRWRMMRTFVHSYTETNNYWYKEKSLRCGANHTPSELLNKIYDAYFLQNHGLIVTSDLKEDLQLHDNICKRASQIKLNKIESTTEGYITPDEYIFRNKSDKWYTDMKTYYTNIKQCYECNIISKQFLTVLDNLEFEKHRKSI